MPWAATKGPSSSQPTQPSAAHSWYMEVSTGTGRPTELTDIPDPGSREGYKIQSWHDVAWKHHGSTGKSFVWGQYNQWGAAAPQGRWTGGRSTDLTLTRVPPHLGTAAKTHSSSLETASDRPESTQGWRETHPQLMAEQKWSPQSNKLRMCGWRSQVRLIRAIKHNQSPGMAAHGCKSLGRGECVFKSERSRR